MLLSYKEAQMLLMAGNGFFLFLLIANSSEIVRAPVRKKTNLELSHTLT